MAQITQISMLTPLGSGHHNAHQPTIHVGSVPRWVKFAYVVRASIGWRTDVEQQADNRKILDLNATSTASKLGRVCLPQSDFRKRTI